MESRLNSAFWSLRIAFGLTAFLAGLDKFFNLLTNWEKYVSPLALRILPISATTLMHIAGVIEVIGGTFFFFGLFTRPVAFILSGEMAIAYFIGHAGHGFWPVLNQGAPAVFYCFTFLYFSAAGGGAWSLDAFLARQKNVVPVS